MGLRCKILSRLDLQEQVTRKFQSIVKRELHEMFCRQLVSSLPAVKEAGCEENNGDHKGQAGVKNVVQSQAEERVRKPRGKAQKPYPSCLLEHPHASMLQEKLQPR